MADEKNKNVSRETLEDQVVHLTVELIDGKTGMRSPIMSVGTPEQFAERLQLSIEEYPQRVKNYKEAYKLATEAHKEFDEMEPKDCSEDYVLVLSESIMVEENGELIQKEQHLSKYPLVAVKTYIEYNLPKNEEN